MSDDDKLVQFQKPIALGETTGVNLPEGLENMQLAEDFGDPTSLWNIRKWLQEAMEAKGAKQTGAGMGMGAADIDIILDGCEFNVQVRPIIRKQR